MNRTRTSVIAEPIAELQRQLDQFRSSRQRRTKLPESLWQAAAELARQHGVYSVAKPLRLDYMGLKKRLEEPSSHRRKKPRSAFVELIAPPAMAQHECAIDLECPSGHKMHIQWKASAPPDWISLLRAWREAEG